MIDMTGTRCRQCGKGNYREIYPTDHAARLLHCDHCRQALPRWQEWWFDYDKEDTPAPVVKKDTDAVRLPPEHSYCPHCGHPVVVPLPVEPMYLLADVAAMIPTTVPGLRAFLYQDDRGRALPSHRKKFGPRTYRYFTASEVRFIRSAVFATSQPARRPGQAEPPERHQP